MNMDLLSDLTVLSIVILHSCNSLPVDGQSRPDILTDAFDNNLFKYYFLNVVNNNKSIERLSDLSLFDDLTNNIINDVPSPTEFRFEKTQYEINAHTGFVGILGHFCVVTNETSQIAYGLSSDDVYINKVFRLGPDSGILYADSSINIGDYRFNITADVSRKQLHAVAEVNVKVTKSLTETDDDDDVNFKVRNIRFTLTGIRIFNEDSTNQQASTLTENILGSDNDGQGDVNTNDIVLPSRLKLWQKFLKKGFSSGLQYSDIKDLLLVRSQPPSEQERNRVLFPLLSTNSRHKRAISPKHFSTAPNAVNAAPSPNTVQSKRIYQESPLADTIMSTFVIFVVSFATIFFFGSIFYFAYKRIKKCGDYEVDEDAKSTTKPVDDETVYSTVQSDMKNPNILSISDISQKRVVDSIEITKQKLNGPASVFTIQRSYEQNALQRNGDGDVFVLDVEHKSNSASTPTITFTLINDQENFPQSILSTSRRNSVSSSKKDGSSLYNESFNEDGPQLRRKSVTFSDTIALYHG